MAKAFNVHRSNAHKPEEENYFSLEGSDSRPNSVAREILLLKNCQIVNQLYALTEHTL